MQITYNEFVRLLCDAKTYDEFAKAYDNFAELSDSDKENVRNTFGEYLTMAKQSIDAKHKKGTLEKYIQENNGHLFSWKA